MAPTLQWKKSLGDKVIEVWRESFTTTASAVQVDMGRGHIGKSVAAVRLSGLTGSGNVLMRIYPEDGDGAYAEAEVCGPTGVALINGDESHAVSNGSRFFWAHGAGSQASGPGEGIPIYTGFALNLDVSVSAAFTVDIFLITKLR